MGIGPDFGWPTDPVNLMKFMRDTQFGFFNLEHFDGMNNGGRSAMGYFRVLTGGGTGNTADGPTTGAIGVGGLALPAQVAPVAADGAGVRHQTNSLNSNDLVGVSLWMARVQSSNWPKAGSDYKFYGGIVDAETGQVEPSDGWYAYADNLDANWVLRHRRAGTLIEDPANFALAGAAVWQSLAVIADANAGTVRMWAAADGDAFSEVASVTPVNVQGNVPMCSMAAMRNDGNITLAASARIDYIGTGWAYGVRR